jgi:3-oxoacyl-(acyl-carrier-protein) synthase
MFLGAGAVAMVIETQESYTRRAHCEFTPRQFDSLGQHRVDLLATHMANSAFHASLLDAHHVNAEFERFVSRLENSFLRAQGIDRKQFAADLLYFAHETCTKGCARVELDALRHVFGNEAFSTIRIVHCKALTGHCMGASPEDVVAVASLAQNYVPPIPKEANEFDGSLNLSCQQKYWLLNGGQHDRNYALRFAAGFGSQIAFSCMRRRSD